MLFKFRPFYIGMEVDDFVETSANLLQPLEDFFNKVFVMVVRSIWSSLMLNINAFGFAVTRALSLLLSIIISLMFMHVRALWV